VGHIVDDPDAVRRCPVRIDSLEELPALVAKYNGCGG
jgi:hypothetical protein